MWCQRVPVECRRVPGKRGHLLGMWERVQEVARALPACGGSCGLRWRLFHCQMVDRSKRSPKWLPVCRFRAWKLVFWASNSTTALERMNNVAGFFSSTWERVTSPMEFFPSYNDRSEDDLSVGGGLGPSRFLEHRFRKKWWLSRSWWRVGAQPIIPEARESAWRVQ